MERSRAVFDRVRPYVSRRGIEGPNKFARRDKRPFHLRGADDFTERSQRPSYLSRREGDGFTERGRRPFLSHREGDHEGRNRPLPLSRRLGEKSVEEDHHPFRDRGREEFTGRDRSEIGPDRRTSTKRAGERAFDFVKRHLRDKVSRWRVPAPTCVHHRRDCGSSHLHFSRADEEFHWACEIQPDHHNAHVRHKWSDIFAAARFGGCDGGGYKETALLSRDLWKFLPREERMDGRKDLAEELSPVSAEKRTTRGEERGRIRQHPYNARSYTWRRERSRTASYY